MTPKLIAIPFGRDGNKNTIYDTRQTGQAENEATWATGFPPITMQSKTDGGLPPLGLDFNGIFFDLSSNIAHTCMGGQYYFDKDYAAKINGYPKGAILLNKLHDKQYISNIDNNKIDFNTADTENLTAWSIISIAGIDKLLDGKINNIDFSEALNKKADASRNMTAGNGLTGGGTLESNRTFTLGTPTKISGTSKNDVTAESHTHEIDSASTTQKGIVQLTDVLDTSKTLAASQFLVNEVSKSVDLVGIQANNNAKEIEKKVDELQVKNAYLTNAGAYTGATNDTPVLTAGSNGLSQAGSFLKNNPGLDFTGVIPASTWLYYEIQSNYSSDNFVATFKGYNSPILLQATKRAGADWVKPVLFIDSSSLDSLMQVPVDQIFYFDSATPPTGYIARNGQAIDKVKMPKLFAVYGANMPDDRDRVHRMTGTLAGAVGTTQEDAIRNIVGQFNTLEELDAGADGVFNIVERPWTPNTQRNRGDGINPTFRFDASTVVPTASENRVKSRIILACNKIQ